MTNRQPRICARNKDRARSATTRAALDFRDAASHSAGVNALLFDTLRLSRILPVKGHFTSEQAEALAEALGKASHGDLATKADLANLATKAELAAVRTEIAELRVEIAGTKIELLKWIIVVALGFQTIVILGALISFVRLAAK